MTAKERLLEFVETLDESDAETALLILDDELAPRQPLTPTQLASLHRAVRDALQGSGTPEDVVYRRLGIEG